MEIYLEWDERRMKMGIAKLGGSLQTQNQRIDWP